MLDPISEAFKRLSILSTCRFIDIQHRGSTLRIWRSGQAEDLGFSL